MRHPQPNLSRYVGLHLQTKGSAAIIKLCGCCQLLGSYFCVPTLFEHTNKFIQQDARTSNIHMYLKETLLYLDDKMIWATMGVAADSWMSLAPTDSLSIEVARYLELLLPQEKQIEVMQLALQRAASAFRSFRCPTKLRFSIWTITAM
jgi:hypothetical protein